MSQPLNLPHVGSTSSNITQNYDWRPSPSHDSSTHYAYAMYNKTGSPPAYFDIPGSLIQVEKSTNTWSDYDTANHPNNVVDNGTTVTFDYSGAAYEFTKPAQWWTTGSGSGGGSSTLSVAAESGSLTLVNGDVVYVVDGTSITHTYYLKIDGLFAGGSHSNWQHTEGTESGGTFPNAQDGKYTLEYEESNAPFNHVKIAQLSVGLKVFTNFW